MRLARTEVRGRGGGGARLLRWLSAAPLFFSVACANFHAQRWVSLWWEALPCYLPIHKWSVGCSSFVQNDEERQRVEAEMEGSSETRAILDALHATRATGTWLPTAKCTAGCIPFCAADNASVLAACREA